MFGILLIDKPKGITSHDAVYRVRRRLGIKRVGHLGTLDPMATGLLVLGIGSATRFLRYIEAEPKVYTGTMKFGVTTTTQDAEGEVMAERGIQGLAEDAIRQAASQFVGAIEQIPPMYSAVKIGGERLYKMARKGIEVERGPRHVTVHKFEISKFLPPLVDFEVSCSGGTYVRTLANDLGERLGAGAHLTALRRTNIGGFSVDEACALETASDADLLPLEQALSPLLVIDLDDDLANMALHGESIPATDDGEGSLAILTYSCAFLAVARRTAGGWHPETVMPRDLTISRG
ncbi:MAG: tRNA pseudouridine(55) synthase TruB [Armatimonadetes bacterium]|nr:tRNA pseudouridine(55) synthase TruB [Armatimonadota bacterium]